MYPFFFLFKFSRISGDLRYMYAPYYDSLPLLPSRLETCTIVLFFYSRCFKTLTRMREAPQTVPISEFNTSSFPSFDDPSSLSVQLGLVATGSTAPVGSQRSFAVARDYPDLPFGKESPVRIRTYYQCSKCSPQEEVFSHSSMHAE